MPDREVIIAVFDAGIGLAGILLVFAGFLAAKAESFETKRGDKYRALAKSTLIPILAALLLSWLSLMALEGNASVGYYLLTAVKTVLVITAVFATVGILASFS